mgnify:CR=1 FL=1
MLFECISTLFHIILNCVIRYQNRQKKKQPQQKARKEYTGPKVEGEDFDD